MKTTIQLALLLFLSATHAQKLQPVEVKDKAMTALLGSISAWEKFTFQNNMVTVITAKDVDGKHHSSETDEVAATLFITNCESGEGMDCKLYTLKNLVALKVDKVYEEAGSVKVTISYGNASARKSETLLLPSR